MLNKIALESKLFPVLLILDSDFLNALQYFSLRGFRFECISSVPISKTPCFYEEILIRVCGNEWLSRPTLVPQQVLTWHLKDCLEACSMERKKDGVKKSDVKRMTRNGATFFHLGSGAAESSPKLKKIVGKKVALRLLLHSSCKCDFWSCRKKV